MRPNSFRCCWTTTVDGSPFEVKVTIDDEVPIEGVGDLWETIEIALFEMKKMQHCLGA